MRAEQRAPRCSSAAPSDGVCRRAVPQRRAAFRWGRRHGHLECDYLFELSGLSLSLPPSQHPYPPTLSFFSLNVTLQAKARGNIGAAIYETVSYADGGVVVSPMELVIMWHAPLVGKEPQVGCRIGVAGTFSKMDGDALATMIGDATNHSSSPQQRVVSGHVATACYGREISRFSIGLEAATPTVASDAGDGGARTQFGIAEAGAPAASGDTKSAAGVTSEIRTRDKPVFAVIPHFNLLIIDPCDTHPIHTSTSHLLAAQADAACFCVTELLNQTVHPLVYQLRTI